MAPQYVVPDDVKSKYGAILERVFVGSRSARDLAMSQYRPISGFHLAESECSKDMGPVVDPDAVWRMCVPPSSAGDLWESHLRGLAAGAGDDFEWPSGRDGWLFHSKVAKRWVFAGTLCLGGCGESELDKLSRDPTVKLLFMVHMQCAWSSPRQWHVGVVEFYDRREPGRVCLPFRGGVGIPPPVAVPKKSTATLFSCLSSAVAFHVPSAELVVFRGGVKRHFTCDDFGVPFRLLPRQSPPRPRVPVRRPLIKVESTEPKEEGGYAAGVIVV